MTNSTKSPKKANLLDPHAIKHLLDESVTEIVTGKGFPEDFRTSNARLGIGSLIIAVALLAQLYPKKFPENRDLLLICIGLPRLGFYGREEFFFLVLWKVSSSELVLSPNLHLFACNWVVNFVFVFGKLWFWMDFYGKDLVFLDFGKYVVLNGILQFISYTKEKDAILFTYPPVGSFTSTGLVVSSKLPRFSDVYTLTIASADPKSISANKPVKLSKSVTKWFTKDGILVEGLFWKDIEGLIDDYKGDHKNKMESEPLLASYPGFLKSNEEEHEGIQLASTNLFLVESQ